MGKLKRIHPADMEEMLARYKQLKQSGLGIMEACEVVGQEWGRHVQTVYDLMRRLSSTTGVAEHYLKAQAMRLAVRVVRDASAQEAIDLLSRKNMGVIAPKQEAGAGNTGFFLSVQADSCGAVKIGVSNQAPEPEPPALPPYIDVKKEPVYVPRPKQGHVQAGPSPAQQKAIAAANERLRKARRRARRLQKYQEIGGVQAHHEESEGPESVEV